MAFSLYASRSGVTTNLSDDNPFAFESLQEASSAPVVRFQQSGPLQHGVSDLGFRIQPRILELNLRFYAATAATLDTYRQTLMDTFAPLSDISIFLYCQRDDGTTLRLTVFTVGEIEIDLVPENYPGHLHRATLKLRAANPLWLDTVVKSTTYSTTASTAWYLAGGAIGTADVLMFGEFPGLAATWSYAGSVPGDFTVAMLTSGRSGTTLSYAYHVLGTGTNYGLLHGGTVGDSYLWNGVPFTNAQIPATDTTLFHANRTTPLSTFYRNGTVLGTAGTASSLSDAGAVRRWRTDGFGLTADWGAITRYALYNSALNGTQAYWLNHWMNGSDGFGTATLTAVNSGDVAAFPLIRIRGPMFGIVVTNTTTGATFNLGTTSVPAGEIYTIDLRDGDKRVYDSNSVNRMGAVTSADLASFSLQPAPIAAGGTNIIQVTGTATSVSARITIEHYNQYMSF